MDIQIIGGVTYEYDDLGEKIRYRRYDEKVKKWIEVYCPKNTDRDKKAAEEEIMRVLSDLYITRMISGDEYKDGE